MTDKAKLGSKYGRLSVFQQVLKVSSASCVLHTSAEKIQILNLKSPELGLLLVL